jgi:hypothetical protein
MSKKIIAPIAAGVLLAMAGAAPLAALAESNFVTGGGTLNAAARVDFQITIPNTLFLQVGTGTLFANSTAVDLIDFNVPAATIGDGNSVAATVGSGDLGNGTVTAIVRANGGNATLGASTAGAIGNGAGDSINWNEITTTAAALSTGTVLPAPVLANGASANVALAAVAGVVNQDARWTYAYDNTTVVPAGVYGGVNANNSRVTYTASLP